jgi:hypothetical protein
MITGTPKSFPVNALDLFSIGDVEGKNDTLLEECLCEIAPIREFLLGKKDIVLGERGAGKSALFRTLSEGRLKFVTPNGKTYAVLALDENIEYKQLKDLIENKIAAAGDKPSIKYQFIWELFITYKIPDLLVNDLRIQDPHLDQAQRDISVALGFEKPKIGFMEFLISHKKTVGVKLDQLHPTTSNFYISTEPTSDLGKDENIHHIDLREVKRHISRALDKNAMVLYVLLDRLDEFVILEEYETQKSLLEGLLTCYRNFSSTSQIRVKLFFRTDIFNQLNLSGLGADKIIAKSVNLKWSGSDLRELIARRLAHNYYEHLSVADLMFRTDMGTLHLDPKYIEEQKALSKIDDRNRFAKWCSKFAAKFKTALLAAMNDRKRVERRTNFNDAINIAVINLIFPVFCEHISTSGSLERIRFLTLLESHLSFSSNYSTPRLVIAFIEKCLYETRSYYSKNKDIKEIPLNSDNEYELVKVGCISRAYQTVKDDVWNSLAREASKWEHEILQLRDKLAAKDEITLEDITKFTTWSLPDEPKRFIALLTHSGILRCKTPHKPHSERLYEFPLLFREASLASYGYY